jgi:hypothetical protein
VSSEVSYRKIAAQTIARIKHASWPLRLRPSHGDAARQAEDVKQVIMAAS